MMMTMLMMVVIMMLMITITLASTTPSSTGRDPRGLRLANAFQKSVMMIDRSIEDLTGPKAVGVH